MSSTNINVGLQEGRNSSRVLKPPGGGHSQIFGGGPEEDKPRPKIKHQNTTEINACFSHGIVEKIEEINGLDKQENVENAKPEPAPNNENEEKEIRAPQQQVPPRARVPPGGYSSGFW